MKLAFWDSAAGRRADAAARADAEGLEKLYCSGLSTDQSDEAWQLASCGLFGVTPQVIALAPGSQIDISRRGLILDTPAGRTTWALIAYVGCGNQVPLLRYSRVDPPVGLGLPSRHLLELAEWWSATDDTTGTVQRVLHWSLFDITSKINVVAFETLEEGSGSGSAWPMPALPADSQATRRSRCSLRGRSTGRSPASRSMVGSSSSRHSIFSSFRSSSPAPSTFRGPQRRGAGRETAIKLGCGCGPDCSMP